RVESTFMKIKWSPNLTINEHVLFLSVLLGLEDLGDDLLLLDKEGAGDAFLNGVGRKTSSVASGDGLSLLAQAGKGTGARGGDLRMLNSGVTAARNGSSLLSVQVHKTASGGLGDLGLVGGGVVRQASSVGESL
ncbi:hypothetical protein PMAYCL1PPCAC_18817, partial [Pristionchus mayeri]